MLKTIYIYLILTIIIMISYNLCANNSMTKKNLMTLTSNQFANISQEDFCLFLSEQEMFRQLPVKYNLKNILQEFKNNKTNFYHLFVTQKENIDIYGKNNEQNPEFCLLALYRLLWIYQDKNKKDNEKNIYKYLDSLPANDRTIEIYTLSSIFGVTIFGEKSYSYFEREIINCCTPGKLFWDTRVVLGDFLSKSKLIFSRQEYEKLVNIAVEKISNLEISKKEIYNNYFFVLADHAGKISQPYFDLYFDNEFSAFNLIAVGEYYKRNFDEATYKSKMQRKISLLKASVKELEQELAK